MDSHLSRALLAAAAAGTALALAVGGGLAGCGSSSGGAAPDGGGSMPDSSTDSGPTESGPTDGANEAASSDGATDAADSGSDAGSDAAYLDCGKVPPTGTQIVASTEPIVLQGGGVTSDGYAFYENTTTQVLYAVNTAGGAPTSLGTNTAQGATFYRNGGKAVLFMPVPGDPMTSIGTLDAWSAASGKTTISTSMLGLDSYNYNYDVTRDGAYVAYVSFNGSGGAIEVSTIDGATQGVLTANIDFSNEYCLPFTQFVGNTLLVYYCVLIAPPDSGVSDSSLQIASFPITSSNFGAVPQTNIVNLPAPSAGDPLQAPYAVSPDGTKLLVAQATGLFLYPIAGGPPTLIDANGLGGAFTSSGDVVYQTSSGGLNRYSAAADAGAPLTLDSTGVRYLLSVSPDGNWLQTGQNVNSTGSAIDIWLASATTPGSLTQVWSQTTALPIGFSSDSKYETFGTNFPSNFGIETFDFYSSAVSGGTPQKLLTAAGTLAFTTGSKVVVNTNVDTATGSADIDAIDLSNPGAAATLVAQADPEFFYTASSNKVVYTWYCAPTSTAGLWTVAAP